MSIYKRGGVYWYKFQWKSALIRESTKQGNDKVARQMEAAHKTSLAKGEVGIREKKAAPTLADFCKQRFESWARSSFENTCRNNWYWYRAGIRALTRFKPMADLRLDEIQSEQTADFAAHRHAEGCEVSTINSSLRVLRRMLRLAVEWGALEVAPKIQLLPGERHRERVVTRAEEAAYLAAAPPLLGDVATVLADTGLRPDECYRLRWEEITWTNGRNGTLIVTHGKTAAARRVLPLTPRVRLVLEGRWNRALKPGEGFIWPAPTLCGHVDRSSLIKQHARTFSTINAEAKNTGKQPFKPWVLYAFRHTFLTRLGESGCDAWTLARVAGHSSVSISSRYVHPSEDAVFAAVSRLGGHNSGHSENLAIQAAALKKPQATETGKEQWCARRDSNSRPVAPEATALSS